MVMGGAELGLARGKLTSRWWKLATPVGIGVSGAAFLVHEQNSWLFARSAFLHHLIGWTLIAAALVALSRVARPRSVVLQTAFALIVVALAVMLFADRDVAPADRAFPLMGSLAQVKDTMQAYRAAGLDHLVLAPRALSDVAAWAASLQSGASNA